MWLSELLTTFDPYSESRKVLYYFYIWEGIKNLPMILCYSHESADTAFIPHARHDYIELVRLMADHLTFEKGEGGGGWKI